MAVKFEGLEGSMANAETVFAPAYIIPCEMLILTYERIDILTLTVARTFPEDDATIGACEKKASKAIGFPVWP